MRILMACAAAAMLISAYCLYAINYDTRELADRVQEQERKLEKTRQDIAILKADRAFAGRPSVIGPAARALGLAPASEAQFVRRDATNTVAARPDEGAQGSGRVQ
jgi:hypothetical protein